jgi:hypothetical protein
MKNKFIFFTIIFNGYSIDIIDFADVEHLLVQILYDMKIGLLKKPTERIKVEQKLDVNKWRKDFISKL